MVIKTSSGIAVTLKRDIPQEGTSENFVSLLSTINDKSFRGVPWNLRAQLRNGRELFRCAVNSLDNGYVERALGQLLPIRDYLIKKYGLHDLSKKVDQISGDSIALILAEDPTGRRQAYWQQSDRKSSQIAELMNSSAEIPGRHHDRIREIFGKIASLDLMQQARK